MLFIGINLENGAGSQYNNHLHQRFKSISLTSRGFLRDEFLCAKRLGYGGWAEKLGSVLATSLYRLAPWTSADFVRGLWGFFYCLSLTTSLLFFFFCLGQADLWLHMDDLEMLYALLWEFKRGLRSRLKEYSNLPNFTFRYHLHSYFVYHQLLSPYIHKRYWSMSLCRALGSAS